MSAGPRYQSATHLLALVDQLDQGLSLTIQSIRDHCEVDRAAATRYVTWLKRHRPLQEAKAGRHKVWRLAGRPRDGQVDRSVALDLALQALAPFAGTPAYSELEALAEQARSAIAEREEPRRSRLAASLAILPISQSRAPHRQTVVRRLYQAISKRRHCAFRYTTLEGVEARYRSAPWGLVLRGERLFLVAGKDEHRAAHPQRRLFDVDAIGELEVDEHDRFAAPATHHTDYATLFQPVLGSWIGVPGPIRDIHIRVRGRAAVELRRRGVHPSQTSTEGPDGALDVRLRVKECPDLVRLVQALLPDVAVLAPKSLADKTRKCAREWLVRDLHGDPTGPG